MHPSRTEPPSEPTTSSSPAKHRDVLVGGAAGVSRRVERALRSRWAPRGTTAAHLEAKLKRDAERAWSLLKKRPVLGVLGAGGIGLALATLVGPGELVVGVSAGYAAYLVLREGVSPAVAVKETIVGRDQE